MNLLHESCFFSEQSPIFMGLWFTFIPPRFSSPQREQRHGGGPSCFPRDFYNPSSDVPVQGSCSGALSSAKPPQSRGEIRVLVRWAGVGKKWQINRDTRECAVSECNPNRLKRWRLDSCSLLTLRHSSSSFLESQTFCLNLKWSKEFWL